MAGSGRMWLLAAKIRDLDLLLCLGPGVFDVQRVSMWFSFGV